MSRAYCYQCQKAGEACICGLLPKIHNRTNVVVLQHPTETRNPKGSAIIAKLYLKNHQQWIGENFSHHLLLNRLIEQNPASTAIVYPAKASVSRNQLEAYAQTVNLEQSKNTISNLIFIDASWRKASKIWHLSKNLHRLPHIRLQPAASSNYRIRKSPGDDHLSTIEAICHCLSQLETSEEKYQPLLDVFDKMIDFQISKMGSETYQKNYLK